MLTHLSGVARPLRRPLSLIWAGPPGGQLEIGDVSSMHKIGFIWNLYQCVFQLRLLHWKFSNIEWRRRDEGGSCEKEIEKSFSADQTLPPSLLQTNNDAAGITWHQKQADVDLRCNLSRILIGRFSSLPIGRELTWGQRWLTEVKSDDWHDIKQEQIDLSEKRNHDKHTAENVICLNWRMTTNLLFFSGQGVTNK